MLMYIKAYKTFTCIRAERIKAELSEGSQALLVMLKPDMTQKDAGYAGGMSYSTGARVGLDVQSTLQGLDLIERFKKESFTFREIFTF